MKPLKDWKAQDVIGLVKNVDKKVWIKVGVAAGILAFILGVFVWPAWVTRLELHQKIKTFEEQIATVETLTKKKPELLKDQIRFQKIVEETKVRLFGPGETAFLLGTVSNLAKDSNVSLVASNPKDMKSDFPKPFNEQYETAAYDFVFEGKYHSLGDFVSKLESNPKLLQIRSFQLKPDQVNAQNQLANINLTAVSLKKEKGK